MEAGSWDIVDQAWADVFGCPVEELWDPGVHVDVHESGPLATWPHIYVFQNHSTVRVSLPPSHSHLIEAVVNVEGALTKNQTWHGLLGDDLDETFGPSIHLFSDTAPQVPHDRARLLNSDDAPEIEAFKEAIPDADWIEAGLAGHELIRFGIFDGPELVAMSKLSEWRNTLSDIGVVVAPEHRGNGHGVAVAAAAAAFSIERHEVARYRALTTNVTSLAIADHLAFEPSGQNVSVRLRLP